MSRAGSYNVLGDFFHGDTASFVSGVHDRITDDGYVSTDPYWIVAVFRLGAPLSFDRRTMKSVDMDITKDGMLRAQKPLVITDDCLSISISNQKTSHTKGLQCVLKQTGVNYLTEILPDDWIMCWMMNNRDTFLDVKKRVENLQQANDFLDGLKFVGRVDDVYKDVSVDPQSGAKMSNYSIKATAFRELDTHFFYDYTLGSTDVNEKQIGTWLVRLGVNVQSFFQTNSRRGITKDNINTIIKTLLNLIVGTGPPTSGAIKVKAQGVSDGTVLSSQPQVALPKPADFAYLVPFSVAALLDKVGDESLGVTSYADILELLQGVQHYSERNGFQVFVPDLKDPFLQNRHETPFPMMGTFLPFMPDFANRPLWSVLQQYLNPAVNEMYTCMRVNPAGKVVPTIVLRQIPFTTDAFPTPETKHSDEHHQLMLEEEGPEWKPPAQKIGNFHITRFLELPRWKIPATLIKSAHVGRSNATRTNFVHVYGKSTYSAGNGAVPIQNQMHNNPPVRDDIDIQRSGLHPYMNTTECWVDDTVGKVPSQWISLIADWTIGSHLTLNGQLECFGIQSPICEGDNVAFDGVVYHIQGVTHMAAINPDTGLKTWTTRLELCNGMRDMESTNAVGSTERDVGDGLMPIYPGFSPRDNQGHDPGLTVEEGYPTTGGITRRKASWDDPGNQGDREAAGTTDNSGANAERSAHDVMSKSPPRL